MSKKPTHADYVEWSTAYLKRKSQAPLLIVPSANGIWLPAPDEATRRKIAKIINKMKRKGELLTGAADLQIAWEGPNRLALCCYAEIKTGRDKPSDAQIEFEGDARAVAAEYFLIQDRTWDKDCETILEYIHERTPLPVAS